MEPAILKGDDPVVKLEHKLIAWMKQQPEWLQIMALPRQQRRASMKALANRLYTIPVMDGVNTVPRVVRRKAQKQLAKAALTGELTKEVRAALEKAAQEAVEFKDDDDPATFEGSVPIIGEVDEPIEGSGDSEREDEGSDDLGVLDGVGSDEGQGTDEVPGVGSDSSS